MVCHIHNGIELHWVGVSESYCRYHFRLLAAFVQELDFNMKLSPLHKTAVPGSW